MAIDLPYDTLLKVFLTVAIIIGIYAFFVLSLGAIEFMIKTLKEKFGLDIDYLVKYGVRLGFFALLFYLIYTAL